MAGGGDPWNDGPAWHHRPLPFGALMAGAGFSIGLMRVGDLRAAVGGAVVAGLVGFVMWRPNGFGWRIEASQADRIARGDPEVRPMWVVRAGVIVVGIVVGLLLLAWAAS
jgi:hypothetical protein